MERGLSYPICVASFTGIGALVGSYSLTPVGPVLGGAAGLAWGLIACPRLAPAIRQKLFDGDDPLDQIELFSTLNVLRTEGGLRTESEALSALAAARMAYYTQKRAGTLRPPVRCEPIAVTAARALSA